MENIFIERPQSPNFQNLSKLFKVDQSELTAEWTILIRNSKDFSSLENQIALSNNFEYFEMFPCFSLVTKKLLLLPVGAASVEQSFSSMNRILTKLCNRLTINYLDFLTKISIEGPEIPDILHTSQVNDCEFSLLLDAAILEFNKLPHRISINN